MAKVQSQEEYRVINILKSGKVADNMDGYKVPATEEMKAFYLLMASLTNEKNRLSGRNGGL